MDWMRIETDVASATYETFLPSLSQDGQCTEDGLRSVIEETKKAAKVSREV